MISLEDCIGLCGLTEAEVLALAEHEHIPEIAAAALGQYLLAQPDGTTTIRDMICDDIRVAVAQGNQAHAHELLMALCHFVGDHPELETAPSIQ